MAKAYSISGSYGVILADSGAVIPVGSEGPIELEDGTPCCRSFLQLPWSSTTSEASAPVSTPAFPMALISSSKIS